MPNERIRKFFDNMEAQGLMLTYDDVRLRTQHSNVLPTATNLTTRLSRNIRLKIPIIASPMDTVTEDAMAIAMAEMGGIGFIHRGLSPEEQARKVGRVKRRMSGKIATPTTVRDNITIGEFLTHLKEKPRTFHTFPVINAEEKLVGLLTRTDIEFCDDESKLVSAAMTPLSDLTRAGPQTTVEEALRLMIEHKRKVLPLTSDDGGIAGMYTFSDLKRIHNGGHTTYNLDAKGQLIVGAAVGSGDVALARAAFLAERQCDVLLIDTAHGDTQNVISTLQKLKSRYPHIDVLAGNVSSGDSAKRLADAGADGVLVGQGPGSICTTRVIAGVGVPQVSAVYECVRALEGSDVPIIADGGINSSGDMVIALAVGADSVVLGRLLAGTEEAPGEERVVQGMKVKDYRGMGSQGAMRDNQSSRERYGQGALAISKLVPEGIEGMVPFRGSVKPLLDQYTGGIRSGLGYNGSTTLEELRERAVIFRISSAGLNESHPHDVAITTTAPNYVGRG